MFLAAEVWKYDRIGKEKDRRVGDSYEKPGSLISSKSNHPVIKEKKGNRQLFKEAKSTNFLAEWVRV